MKQKMKLTLACGGAPALIFGALGGVMYYFAYTRGYDKDIHHFSSSSLFPTLMTVFFGAAILCAIITAALMPRKAEVRGEAPDSGTTFTIWFAASVLVCFGLLSMCYDTGAHSDTAFGVICSGAAPVLSALCCIPLALSLSTSLRGSSLHAVTTFIPLLWCAATLFKYYFDISEIPLNDPELTLTVVALSALGMLWLSECRMALGILSPAFAVFSTLPAAAITISISAVRIILYATEGYALPSVYENASFLAVGILGVVRFLGIYAATTLTENEVTTVVE